MTDRKSNPHSIILLAESAKYAYRDGHYKKAEALFRLLTMLSPESFGYWYGLASSLYMQKSFNDASNYYVIATSYDQLDARPYIYRAECLAQLGETASAKEVLQTAQKLCYEEAKNTPYIAQFEKTYQKLLPIFDMNVQKDTLSIGI